MEAINEKETKWCGLMIREKRRKLGWSQESLCHQICSISYLSKIESGSVVPAPDILLLLAKKMELTLPLVSSQDRDMEKQLLQWLQRGETNQAVSFFQTGKESFSKEWHHSIWGILLSALLENDGTQMDALELTEEHARCMDASQLALWMLVKKNYEMAWRLSDEPWLMTIAVYGLYTQRVSETRIFSFCQKAYQRAAEEGYPYLMADLSHLQGIICSNLPDLESARKYFAITRNLFESLHEEQGLESLDYNEACLAFETGDYAGAIAKFKKQKNPSAQVFHKLSLAYELCQDPVHALEAIQAMDQVGAEDWDSTTMEKIAMVSTIRLTQADYLNNPQYGQTLMDLFDELVHSHRHKGFAQFYLPWVIQWLKASRQYARVVSILEDFPGKPLFSIPKPQ